MDFLTNYPKNPGLPKLLKRLGNLRLPKVLKRLPNGPNLLPKVLNLLPKLPLP